MLIVQFLALVYGLCVGSFLNVLIYRLPRGMSLASPPSHCPKCNRRITWRDNLPVVSFVALRGRCRGCGKRISLRYPLIELLHGLLWWLAATLYWADSPLYAISVMLFCTLAISIGFIDLDTMYIYDALLWALAVPVVLGLVAYPASWRARLLGLAVGGGGFWVVYQLSRLLLRREGMGIADVILMAFAGAMLGASGTLFAILIGSLSACVILLPLQGLRRDGRETEYPFAPFLTLGAVVALFSAEGVIAWYVGLFV